MMNRCAVAGLAMSGAARAAASIFWSACARPWGPPAIPAPPWSAANSREREIAAWMTSAARGARMAVAKRTNTLLRRRSSFIPPTPPKMSPHRATEASIMTAAAIVAAIELVRMSRCCTCASS